MNMLIFPHIWASHDRQVPSLGWLQIVGFAGIVELNIYNEQVNDEPGDLPDKISYPAETDVVMSTSYDIRCATTGIIEFFDM